MEFIITLRKNHKHVDFQVTDTIVEAVKICNNHKEANQFQINQGSSDSYISGTKLANGYIDWVRSDLVGIERLK